MARSRHTSTTNDPNVASRHLPQNQRVTHGGPFDPTVPTNGLYGSRIDTEPTWWPDEQGATTGPGNIQDGAVDNDAIAEGSITPGKFDTDPPAAPTDLALETFERTEVDGTVIVVIRVTWANPEDEDLNGVYIEWTDESEDDNGDVPDWTNVHVIFVGYESLVYDVIGVRGSVQHHFRIRGVDRLGNRSEYSGVESITSASDSVAPSVPGSLEAVPGFRGAIVKFPPVAAPDLLEYEVRYTVDDGTGTAPDEEGWVEFRSSSTVVWISGLTPDVRYWFQVQAIDRSGNESGFTADDVDLTSCVPSQVGSADIAANSISAAHISASGISADSIKTGVLAIGTIDGRADGITIYNADATTPDKMVGEWDEDGLKVYADDTKQNYVHITNAGVTVYKNGIAISAMTPDGIDATAIRFGRLQGGHNLIQNSSFEVGAFSTETLVTNASFTDSVNTKTSKSGAVITIDAGAW